MKPKKCRQWKNYGQLGAFLSFLCCCCCCCCVHVGSRADDRVYDGGFIN